jgi:hypothetical protein
MEIFWNGYKSPAWPNTVSSVLSPFPLHRGRFGHAGHNEKRDGRPPVGNYFHNRWFASFISRRVFPHAPLTPPPPLDLPAGSTADLF